MRVVAFGSRGEHLERPREVDLVEPVEGKQPDLQVDFVRDHEKPFARD